MFIPRQISTWKPRETLKVAEFVSLVHIVSIEYEKEQTNIIKESARISVSKEVIEYPLTTVRWQLWQNKCCFHLYPINL